MAFIFRQSIWYTARLRRLKSSMYKPGTKSCHGLRWILREDLISQNQKRIMLSPRTTEKLIQLRITYWQCFCPAFPAVAAAPYKQWACTVGVNALANTTRLTRVMRKTGQIFQLQQDGALNANDHTLHDVQVRGVKLRDSNKHRRR